MLSKLDAWDIWEIQFKFLEISWPKYNLLVNSMTVEP